MTEEDIVRAVALIALLAYLLPGAVRMRRRNAYGLRFTAMVLVGLGVAAGLVLFVVR